MSGDTWTCDSTSVCDSDQAVKGWVVHDYNGTGNHDFSAWVTCNGGAASDKEFCCTFDDHGLAINAVDDVILKGGPNGGGDPSDELYFQETSTGSELDQHRSSTLHGFIFGGAGDDEIFGSGAAGASYRDNLYGEAGDDTINGFQGPDWIQGGPGDDTLNGGAGPDRIVGGEGLDTISGGDGHDFLCDSVYGLAAGCDDNNHFDGGDGNDTVYLKYNHQCVGMGPSANSTCGDSTDDTFASAEYTPVDACEHDTGIPEPSECSDPN